MLRSGTLPSSLEVKLVSWIGDDMEHLDVVLFSDADIAGDNTMRSTTGVFFVRAGGKLLCPTDRHF